MNEPTLVVNDASVAKDSIIIKDPITPATPSYHVSQSPPTTASTATSTTTLNTVTTFTTPNYHPPYPVLSTTPGLEPITSSHMVANFSNSSISSIGSSQNSCNTNPNANIYNPHRLSNSISMPNLHGQNTTKRQYMEAFQPYGHIDRTPPQFPTSQYYTDQPVMIGAGAMLIPASNLQQHNQHQNFQYFPQHLPSTTFQPIRAVHQIPIQSQPQPIQYQPQPQYPVIQGPMQNLSMNPSSTSTNNASSPVVQYQHHNQSVHSVHSVYPVNPSINNKGVMSQIQFPQPTQFIQFVPPKSGPSPKTGGRSSSSTPVQPNISVQTNMQAQTPTPLQSHTPVNTKMNNSTPSLNSAPSMGTYTHTFAQNSSNQFPGQGQFMMQMRVGSQFQVQTQDSFALSQKQESKKHAKKAGEARPHKKRHVGHNPRRVVSVPVLHFNDVEKSKKSNVKKEKKETTRDMDGIQGAEEIRGPEEIMRPATPLDAAEFSEAGQEEQETNPMTPKLDNTQTAVTTKENKVTTPDVAKPVTVTANSNSTVTSLKTSKHESLSRSNRSSTSSAHAMNKTNLNGNPAISSSSSTSSSSSSSAAVDLLMFLATSPTNTMRRNEEKAHKRTHSKTESFHNPSTPSQFNYHEYLNLFTPSPNTASAAANDNVDAAGMHSTHHNLTPLSSMFVADEGAAGLASKQEDFFAMLSSAVERYDDSSNDVMSAGAEEHKLSSGFTYTPNR